MSKPYVPKEPGDIIRSQDWNDMQAQGRAHVESHAHTGAPGQGVKLTGEAIAEDAALSVRTMSVSETLSVRGRDLAGEIDKLNAKWSSGSEEFVAGGGLRVPDADILLRGQGSRDHGLGYYGERRPFASRQVDGPALFGRGGGVLGTRQGTSEQAALTWNDQGEVQIPGRLRVGAQEPWQPLPLIGAWGDQGGAWWWWHSDSTSPPPSFMKDSNGFVHLRGKIDSGRSEYSEEKFAIMPQNYRPKENVLLPIILRDESLQTEILSVLIIKPDGTLRCGRRMEKFIIDSRDGRPVRVSALGKFSVLLDSVHFFAND